MSGMLRRALGTVRNCSVQLLKHRNIKTFSSPSQAYIKIYQGEELPHPKSMLQVPVHTAFTTGHAVHTAQRSFSLVVTPL